MSNATNNAFRNFMVAKHFECDGTLYWNEQIEAFDYSQNGSTYTLDEATKIAAEKGGRAYEMQGWDY